MIANLLHNFLVFHINAFYAALYFLKSNLIFVAVFLAVGYLVHQELEQAQARFVDDQRRIV